VIEPAAFIRLLKTRAQNIFFACLAAAVGVRRKEQIRPFSLANFDFFGQKHLISCHAIFFPRAIFFSFLKTVLAFFKAAITLSVKQLFDALFL